MNHCRKVSRKLISKQALKQLCNCYYSLASPSVPKDDILFLGIGPVIELDDNTYFKSKIGNSAVPQVKGTSVLFDGTGYGVFTDPETGEETSVLLPAGDWSEPIEFTFAYSAAGALIAGTTRGTDEIAIDINSSGIVRAFAYVGTTLTSVLSATGAYNDGFPHKVSLDYQDGIASLTVDSSVTSIAWGLNGSQNLGVIGVRPDLVGYFIGNLWDLTGPGFKLNMACGTDTVHPTVELSATPGGPNCTWSGFANKIYEEHSDGSGFDLNILGWNTGENYILYSEDFTNSDWNNNGGGTIEQFDGYQTYTITGTEFFMRKQHVSGLIGKTLTCMLETRAHVAGESVKLSMYDEGDAFALLGNDGDYIPSDRFTTIKIRCNAALIGDMTLWMKNILTSVGPFDLKQAHLFESKPLGIYSDGDSIAKATVTAGEGSKFNNYTHLLGNRNSVEVTCEAVGGDTLSQISSRVITNLSGEKYPVVILEGGTNDIFEAGTDPSAAMIADTKAMVIAAKASSDNIYLLTVRNNDDFTTAGNEWVTNYNALIYVEYAGDSRVKIIDLNEILNSGGVDITEYFEDGNIHPNLEGHAAIADTIQSVLNTTVLTDKYRYVKTTADPITGRQPAGYNGITDYPGPIAASMKTVGTPCPLGDGTGYAAITGLLTTDVITVPSGSSQPTCTTNGVMDFVTAEKPYHITVARSGTVWAFYPCEAGEGTILEDTISGNNGVLTSFAGDPWSTRDVGSCLMRKNGFTPDRVDSVELWVDPDVDTIDASNYSTYDSETGIGRVVSSGSSIYLDVNPPLIVGTTYKYVYEELSANGSIKLTSTAPDYFFAGSESGEFIAELDKIYIQRGVTPCDVTFKLSVKQVLPGVSVCNTDGLHQDDTAPTYPRNTMDNLYNAPVLHEGANGAPTQALPFFTGLQEIDFTLIKTIIESGTTHAGSNGLAVYSEDKLLIADAIDKKLNTLGDELWVDPSGVSEHSTYGTSFDPITGINRLYTETTSVDPFLTTSDLEVGESYLVKLTDITGTGNLEISDSITTHTVSGTEDAVIIEAGYTSISVTLTEVGDTTFKCTLKRLTRE